MTANGPKRGEDALLQPWPKGEIQTGTIENPASNDRFEMNFTNKLHSMQSLNPLNH